MFILAAATLAPTSTSTSSASMITPTTIASIPITTTRMQFLSLFASKILSVERSLKCIILVYLPIQN